MQNVFLRSRTGYARLTIFVIVWTIGLSLGLFLGSRGASAFSSSLRAASASKLSFGVLISMLPTVLCILLWYFDLPYLIFPLSFLKAFFDGFILFSSAYAFGSALWLVYGLLFFTDRCMNVVFLWFSSLVLHNEGEAKRIVPFLIVLMIMIVSVDYFLISPWLYKLML